MINKKKRIEVYNKYNGHCSYCGKRIQYKEMQVDHAHPKILSHFKATGRDEDDKLIMPDPDRMENLMPSCRRCNHYKRAFTIDGYRRQLQTLHERFMNIYIIKVAVDYGIIKVNPFDSVFYFELQEMNENKYSKPKRTK